MKNIVLLLSLALALGTVAFAAEGAVPTGVPHLDHVFVIMMENHGYSQIVGNANAPYINAYLKSANSAQNYFAVGHPSSTNYLEVVGGSNFGVRSDNAPDWHNLSCTPNLANGSVVTDFPPSGLVCPIAGTGTDAETPAIDMTNECPTSVDPCPPGLNDINGTLFYSAAPNTSGKTIADQLADKGLNWKSYQESLPAAGADNVTYSDGFFTDLSDIQSILPGETQTLIDLYAAKHDPFVFFRSVQQNEKTGVSLKNIVGFEGEHGLYADLLLGKSPTYSFIAPNQCNDQHGRGNAGPQCDFDPVDDGSQAGLNPALIYIGDLTVRTLVTAIHNSPVWKTGNTAIVLLWDENDYSFVPNTNQVPMIVDTNYGTHGRTSAQFYTHFSLLRTIEGGFGLPCLNHACDASTATMTDLFGEKNK